MPDQYSLNNKKIFVAGHNGLVGSSLCERLKDESCEVLTAARKDLDLRDQAAVKHWMNEHKPDAIIIAAAKVGGIQANINAPAEFLYDNLMIEANIIHSAYETGVEKLLFLGSSCMYPREAPQPLKPEYLLSGAFEPTNAPYALAKMAGVELCRTYRKQYGCDFISAIPCNLYGPRDNFDPVTSHVIPALIRKIHEAKEAGKSELELWGTGSPLREFLYIDDLADGLIHLLKNYSGAEPVNIGSGQEVSIKELAGVISGVIGYDGAIVFNPEKPDGMPRKIMDSEYLRTSGWSPSVDLSSGIRQTYNWFLDNC